MGADARTGAFRPGVLYQTLRVENQTLRVHKGTTSGKAVPEDGG
jgi:hypothetical protein